MSPRIRLARRTIGAALLAGLAVSASPVSAATVRYEAETLTPLSPKTSTTVVSGGTGKVRALNSIGTLQVRTSRRIASVTVAAKGTACVDPAYPSNPGGYAKVALDITNPAGSRLGNALPFQLEAPVGRAPTGGAYTPWTFLVDRGASTPYPALTLPATNTVEVSFINDFVDRAAGCDRNLWVDYIEVTS